MKTKFKGVLTLLLALIVQVSFAQEKTVSGTVSDNTGGLPGVSVLLKVQVLELKLISMESILFVQNQVMY